MEELSLSVKDLYELMGSFLSEGHDCRLKIQCTGASMTPFIRNKNIVTIKPLNNTQTLKNGDIVVAAVHDKKRIIIHRIIAITPQKYNLKGDNNKISDGWFHKKDILGIVEKIETTTGFGYTPKHWQNLIIALGSRSNILKHALLPGLKFLKEMR